MRGSRREEAFRPLRASGAAIWLGFSVREDQFPIPILASPALDLAPEQSQFEPALLDGDKFDLSASARGSVNAWRPAAFTTRPRGAAPASLVLTSRAVRGL